MIAVSEQREAALAGCAGQSYTSPPQSLEQARALAGLLLGGPVAGTGPWRQAIAGGQRTVALIAEVDGDAGQPVAASLRGRGLAAAREPQKGEQSSEPIPVHRASRRGPGPQAHDER